MLFVNQPKVIAGIIHLYVPGEGGELILWGFLHVCMHYLPSHVHILMPQLTGNNQHTSHIN
jgi:hypothetical protein